jgi:hypothetical protein
MGKYIYPMDSKISRTKRTMEQSLKFSYSPGFRTG